VQNAQWKRYLRGRIFALTRHTEFKEKIVCHLIPILLLSLLAIAPAWHPSEAASDDEQTYLTAQGRFEQELSRLARSTGGTVGIAAIHIESGRRVSLHGDERFPMASTYKIPIAVQLLTRVEKGEISLGDMIEVKASDLHLGTGTLAGLLNQPGVILSVRNLLELMLVVSDNSATDLLLRLAGGPEAVTSHIAAMGITGIDVSRSTLQMIADRSGFDLPPEEDWTLETLQNLETKASDDSRRAAVRRFEADRRDTSTPDAMVLLLECIYHGSLLKPETTDLLLGIMSRCRTGEGRLKGLLPPKTAVAHKTGTFAGSVVDDVGILTLPDGGGHVAVAVFMKSPEADDAESGRAIAHISRAIYDFFLFHP
jgi:beta-lactamase class A